jgi:16S rRNA (adenine1518-N6/adenine1519-N6)-dimethyltransferase
LFINTAYHAMLTDTAIWQLVVKNMANNSGGHAPRKRFGQNFLQDDGVIQAIARAISANKDDHIVEIGPGQGALTESLVTSGCQLDAIELDRDLTTGLLAAFSIHPRFTLHTGDALKFNYEALRADDRPLRVVGNLPYNISTPLIFKLLENTAIIGDMHFMLQREVVTRLAAQPGSKDWGRLGVMAQFYCDVSHLFDVPPEAFFPPPKVQSAIVRLIPHATPPYPNCDVVRLGRTVQMAFAQRRKTLRNNFKGVLDDKTFASVDVAPTARAETLRLEQFVALSKLPGIL